MMTVLSLDTALGACSAAVAECTASASAVRAASFELRARGHAEALVPMIARTMAEAGLDFTQIDRFAVTIGPGSFTGLRVGLATARGLALAAGRPLIGISTLEAIAANVPASEAGPAGGIVVAAIDARRDELYVDVFGPGLRSLSGPCLVSRADAVARIPEGPAVVAGSGAGLLAGLRSDLIVSAASPQPDAAVFGPLAATRPAPLSPPEPLYLRGADAKLPRQLGVARQTSSS